MVVAPLLGFRQIQGREIRKLMATPDFMLGSA
jgi:hypothetical protein